VPPPVGVYKYPLPPPATLAPPQSLSPLPRRFHCELPRNPRSGHRRSPPLRPPPSSGGWRISTASLSSFASSTRRCRGAPRRANRARRPELRPPPNPPLRASSALADEPYGSVVSPSSRRASSLSPSAPVAPPHRAPAPAAAARHRRRCSGDQ
jgi:hypothetical protein